MKNCKSILIVFASFLLFSNILSFNVKSCKDIVAVGDATLGDYNLFLKVRDPSRPGPQVLCIMPEGYEYTYHKPWNGKPISFKTKQRFIGVATLGDVIPNIVKAGMTLTQAGIAYGDADTNSNWVNPTKFAWDDFDWIRYSCQEADDEQEAVTLLTNDCVDKLHVTGVSENLFVVGPEKAFVVEADAFRYKIKEIDDVLVMSNYPKMLWKTQVHKCLPISLSFDTIKEKYVRKGTVLRLNSVYGIRVVDIGKNWIIARQVPFLKISYGKILIAGKPTQINLGERKTVGDFSVELLDTDKNKAKIKLCYKFKSWEDKMMEHIQQRYGSITVKDMINLSRLHREDLDGLRPMCEDSYKYEAVAIYKIPENNYEIMSEGWFSPNHACSSIYVPFHISNTDIYEPYENGEAAELSIELLAIYGHNNLSNSFAKAEEVFLYEMNGIDDISGELISKRQKDQVSDFLTVIDVGMQKQAWLTEEIWLEISKISNQRDKEEIIKIVDSIWEKNYTFSLKNIRNVLVNDIKKLAKFSIVKDKIEDIAIDICETKINLADVIGIQNLHIKQDYEIGKNLVKQGYYRNGFDILERAYKDADILINGETPIEPVIKKSEKKIDVLFYFLVALLILAFFLLFLKMRPEFD